MSDELSALSKMMTWLHTPKTYNSEYEEEKFEEKDDIWHGEHIFEGHWVTLQNKVEWYESPNVVSIYKDHKYIFNQNMDLSKPKEYFYFQNMDSGSFASEMRVEEDLPSSKGDLKLTTEIETQSAPSGDNEFALVEYMVTLDVKYNFPDGITFMPRILALPLNRLFKRLFVRTLGEEMIEYDVEYARERMAEYFNYLRKYHGEEPVQTKTKQSSYEPPTDDIFFQ